MRTLLQIGEVAQLLGVTPKTIRHYQKIGLLQEPERTEAGYRLYNAQDLLRLQRIRRLQSLGLSLKQVKAVLGEPKYERTLKDVLQSLDEEFAAQIQMLEERRERIRALFDEDALDAFDKAAINDPAFEYMKQHLKYISPTLLEQEMQLYSYLNDFHWSENQQEKMQQMSQLFMQYFTAHPEEYQQLLTLAERFAAIASLPQDAPQVQQLAEDFIQHVESSSFFSALRAQLPQQQIENPFRAILSDLQQTIYSPAQLYVLQEIEHKYSQAWLKE